MVSTSPITQSSVKAITVNDDGKDNWVRYVGQGSADEELVRMTCGVEE